MPTNEIQMTAVQWLIQNIVEDQTIKAKSMSEWIKIFEQAKAMEKEQIIDAYKQGQYDSEPIRETDAEQYYNKIYKTI
jgi:hypothetical protein